MASLYEVITIEGPEAGGAVFFMDMFFLGVGPFTLGVGEG